MEDRSVIHSTFVIERSYPTTSDRVFAAFADPAKKRRWFVEGGRNQVEHFEMDFRVGGKERAIFSHEGPANGMLFTNDGSYQDIAANHRVVIASTMAMGDRRISASLTTFEFLPSQTGTELIFTHQGAFFEGADGPVMREEGWRKLLERLAAELNR